MNSSTIFSSRRPMTFNTILVKSNIFIWQFTCQPLETINILSEIFGKLLFILQHFKKIMSRIWQIVHTRKEFFRPCVKRSWIISVTQGRWWWDKKRTKISSVVPEVVYFENGFWIWKIVLFQVCIYASIRRPRIIRHYIIWLLKEITPCNVMSVNLKSGMPLAVLSPAPAITTIFWAPSTTNESY